MEKGKLYIIATPIGNSEDITLRALRILREDVDCVFCEDTRRTGKLLNQYGIKCSIRSLHAHSTPAKIKSALSLLARGKTIAYCTDSGTPSVSDPGSALVSAARREGIEVIPLPGASALAAIVSVSGFPEKNIIFAGFLSKKEGKRRRELEKLKGHGIIVLYESPYRIKKLIRSIAAVFPDSEMVIGREMTKLHEEFISGTTNDICENIDSILERGEFTVAIYNR
jgi:16S rRNA (cytidine1402-2'-O)-methyltransferase